MWRKHVKRFVTACAVGAAGTAAAVYAYRWYFGLGEENSTISNWLADWDEHQNKEEDEEFNDRNEGGGPQNREDESVVHHFHNIQQIADRIHFPRVLQNMGEHLFKADEVERLRDHLKQASSASRGGSIDSSQRLELWNELKVWSFVRFLVTTWMVPLSFLVTRAVLGLMGRSMYMGHAVDQIHRGLTYEGRRRNPLPPLFTKECQMRLLGLLDMVPVFTLPRLLEKAHAVVDGAVGGVDLKEPHSMQDLMDLISKMQEDFEMQLSEHNWGQSLGTEEISVIESTHANALLRQPHYWSETGLVDDVLIEARNLLNSDMFRMTLVTSVKAYIQTCITQISEVYASIDTNNAENAKQEKETEEAAGKLPEESQDISEDSKPATLPFAKCATLVAKLSKGCFDLSKVGMEGVLSLGVVHDFSIGVYTTKTTPE